MAYKSLDRKCPDQAVLKAQSDQDFFYPLGNLSLHRYWFQRAKTFQKIFETAAERAARYSLKLQFS